MVLPPRTERDSTVSGQPSYFLILSIMAILNMVKKFMKANTSRLSPSNFLMRFKKCSTVGVVRNTN
ncbi:MAG: hypothetical protein WA095_03880 [Minisyncoccia bacterium]